MRFKTLIITFAGLILSAPSWAGVTVSVAPMPPSSINSGSNSAPSGEQMQPTTRKEIIINEMNVIKLDGTIMVEHADKTQSTPLATGSVVEKGDIITVYGDSWVILKDHRGDRIGLDGNTVVTIDECFMAGPDRQIRLLVQRGTLFLETNGDDSRQSFFEINFGNVVASIDELKSIMSYDPGKTLLDVKYIEGKLNIIDQNHEETFTIHQGEYNGYTKTEADNGSNRGEPEEHTEHTWVNGKMMEDEPIPMEEIDELNFRKFFDGEKRLIPDDNNMLLDDSNRVAFPLR